MKDFGTVLDVTRLNVILCIQIEVGGKDAGAANCNEVRQMHNLAYEQGTHTIIATPHFSGKQETRRLRGLADQLAKKAKKSLLNIGYS